MGFNNRVGISNHTDSANSPAGGDEAPSETCEPVQTPAVPTTPPPPIGPKCPAPPIAGPAEAGIHGTRHQAR